MKTLPKNCPKAIFTYYSKLLLQLTLLFIIYYLLYSLFLFFYTLIFNYTIEGAKRHTFHYDYTLYDYM